MIEERPSTPGLIGDAIKQASTLVSLEVQLARTEVGEKVTLMIISIAGIAAAAVFIIVALIFLLQGLIELLVRAGWAPFAASFTIGGIIGVIALIAAFLAARNLSGSRLVPARTIRQVKGTADFVRSPR